MTLKTGSREQDLLVDRVINCTGPSENITRVRNPLLVNLMKRKLVRPDPLQLGLEVDDNSRVVAGDGLTHNSMFALGGLTKGRWWEITAIPEIRAQAEHVAGLLASLPPSSDHTVA